MSVFGAHTFDYNDFCVVCGKGKYEILCSFQYVCEPKRRTNVAKLYQFAVIRKADTDGHPARVVIYPGNWVLAENEEEVRVLAHRAIPEMELEDGGMSRLEVVIRPF